MHKKDDAVSPGESCCLSAVFGSVDPRVTVATCSFVPQDRVGSLLPTLAGRHCTTESTGILRHRQLFCDDILRHQTTAKLRNQAFPSFFKAEIWRAMHLRTLDKKHLFLPEACHRRNGRRHLQTSSDALKSDRHTHTEQTASIQVVST